MFWAWQLQDVELIPNLNGFALVESPHVWNSTSSHFSLIPNLVGTDDSRLMACHPHTLKALKMQIQLVGTYFTWMLDW